MNIDHYCIGKSFFVVQRYFKIFLNCRLKEYGINAAQFMVLHVLTREDGLSQEAINEDLHFDKGFLARVAKSLEQEGYITRKVNKEDRRAYKLFLTDKTIAFKPIMVDILYEWDSTILQDISEKEIEGLKNILDGMLGRVSKKCKEVKEGK